MPQSFVFIVTYGRSGSTLLQNLLNRLPGYLIRGENQNALGLLARSWAEVALSPSRAIAHNRDTPTEPHLPWYGIENVDIDGYGQALAEVFTRQFLLPAPDTRVSGFKEIRWHTGSPAMIENRPLFDLQLDFLRRYFPNAKFIFNTRNLDEVMASGWWQETDPAVSRPPLERANGLFAAYQAAHPECCLSLYYSDYRDNPEALRPVFDFLDEPYDAALVQSVLDHKLTHLKE